MLICLQFQSIADEVGVSCEGTVQCLCLVFHCLVAMLLTATWHLYSHQKREGEGLCWLTLAGTDPGQWWCCVSSLSSSSSFGRPSFSCSIICHAGSFIIRHLVDHCLVATLLTVTWCLLSLSEEGGGGIMLAFCMLVILWILFITVHVYYNVYLVLYISCEKKEENFVLYSLWTVIYV